MSELTRKVLTDGFIDNGNCCYQDIFDLAYYAERLEAELTELRLPAHCAYCTAAVSDPDAHVCNALAAELAEARERIAELTDAEALAYAVVEQYRKRIDAALALADEWELPPYDYVGAPLIARRAVAELRSALTDSTGAEQTASDGVAQPPIELIYWHCLKCGSNTPALPPYAIGDSEPCVYCSNGVARVMTIQDAARAEQVHVLKQIELARTIQQPSVDTPQPSVDPILKRFRSDESAGVYTGKAIPRIPDQADDLAELTDGALDVMTERVLPELIQAAKAEVARACRRALDHTQHVSAVQALTTLAEELERG